MNRVAKKDLVFPEYSLVTRRIIKVAAKDVLPSGIAKDLLLIENLSMQALGTLIVMEDEVPLVSLD